MHGDRVTVIFFVGLVVAIILHEISHGVVAFALGDDTAKRAGRLTLNPVPHVDPFGSIFLPVVGALTHVPVIGWAKPVPVSPARLRNPRRDLLLVSLAGPGTNFALAVVAALAARSQFHANGAELIVLRDLPLPVLVPLLRRGQPLPRRLQLPSDPAARRRRARRASASAHMVAGLAHVPALRHPGAVRPRVQHPHHEQPVPTFPRSPLPVRSAMTRMRHLAARFAGSVWESLGRADRAESVATARGTLAALGPDADPTWLAAALLHDVGKAQTGLGAVGRACATVAAGVAGHRRARAWPGRAGRYVNHDELGARRLREAGARPEVVAWADAHHRRERWPATGIPVAICEVLAAADGETYLR